MSRIPPMTPTCRSFMRADFLDEYGRDCSIQESSIMDDHGMLWLGANEGLHIDGECCARMHIDKELAEELIPLLQYFIVTGRLPESNSVSKNSTYRKIRKSITLIRALWNRL